MVQIMAFHITGPFFNKIVSSVLPIRPITKHLPLGGHSYQYSTDQTKKNNPFMWLLSCLPKWYSQRPWVEASPFSWGCLACLKCVEPVHSSMPVPWLHPGQSPVEPSQAFLSQPPLSSQQISLFSVYSFLTFVCGTLLCTYLPSVL